MGLFGKLIKNNCSYTASFKELNSNESVSVSKSKLDAIILYLHGTNCLNYEPKNKTCSLVPNGKQYLNEKVYLYSFKTKDKDNKRQKVSSLEELKLLESKTLEEFLDDFSIKINIIDNKMISDRKAVYKYCVDRAKTLCKETQYFTKKVYFGESDQDTLKEFMNFISNEISIFSADLWNLNPKARTEEDLNNKIYKEADYIAKTINEEISTKYSGYFIDYVGDWDDVMYDLIYKKTK